MAEVSYPFGTGDVDEAEWRKMAPLWASTAVVSGALNGLAVSEKSGGANMSVDVATGRGWVEGHFYENDAVKNLAIAANASGNPRIDRVVLRADFTADTVTAVILEGTPAASPSAPALTQNTAKWEISLAQIAVANGAASIVNANITDERSYTDPIPSFAAADAGKVVKVASGGTALELGNATSATSTGTQAEVNTTETTTSTAYTDLATVGPSVTLTVNTRVLVIVSAGRMSNSGANESRMAFALSGANTRAAGNVDAAMHVGTSATAASRATVLTGLTAGSTTFTAKYAVAAGTGSFDVRRIVVIPLD